jgi:sugar lactone lactonase YvrE
VFIAGSRNAEVFEYDEHLELVSQWTHPKFGEVLPAPGQSYAQGPEGMVFDAAGRLVVATLTDFCVFSEPGVELACYPKIKAQPTENIIFDSEGRLYTTTATGGTNEVHKYDDKYQYITTFSAPTGELTGITCDPDSNLYVASQTGACLYKFDKTTLEVLDTIPVSGNLEGLQFSGTSSIYVASWGAGIPAIQRVQAQSPGSVLSTVGVPDFAFAVPITTDGKGNIYIADYENGSGTAPADLYVVTPQGDVVASRLASEVYGPFGMVVAGTELPCGAFHQ